MCLQSQVIDDDNDGVGRGRREEDMTRPRDWRQQRRWRGLNNGPKESTTTTEASAEEYEHKDFNNNNRGVVG